NNAKKENCFVRNNRVTSICRRRRARNCAITPNRRAVAATLLPQKYVTLKGTLRTVNVFMVNWDFYKWRNIFYKVERFLARGRFPQDFANISINFSLNVQQK
ncbi:hypothetical protein DICVIV_14366, partial [Dictyocaulus viviparus]